MAMKSLRLVESESVGSKIPHFHGHRARLRSKFEQGQGKGLADYELLELLLFLAVPRGDMKPLAKTLLQKFGSLAALLKADERLVLDTPSVGLAVLHVIQLVQSMMVNVLQ